MPNKKYFFACCKGKILLVNALKDIMQIQVKDWPGKPPMKQP